MLEKVLSGGQTGADVAGMLAAKKCGLLTGGWMPKGWRTQDGPKPHFEKMFGMEEHHQSAYPGRTFKNVMSSDGTVRIAYNFTTAGEVLTKKAIDQYKKPWFDVDPSVPGQPSMLADWIIANDIVVLNVAGNSKKTSPTIGPWAYRFLLEVFEELKARQAT